MKVQLFEEFKASIKSPDTEEKIDLIFYRPLGFLVAKIAYLLSMSPTHLSLLGLLSGCTAAYFFTKSGNGNAWFIGSLLFLLSGIFDSSDGQLARLAGKGTKLGVVIDGVCDSLVTIAIYLAASWPYLLKYGTWYLVVIIPALFLHSSQCAILDFYHREYLYFGRGKIDDETYWNPGLEEAYLQARAAREKKDRILSYLRISWIKQQRMLSSSSRSEQDRQKWRFFLKKASPPEAEEFKHHYRQANLKLLPFWRLLGPNFHTFVIIIFLYFRSFNLYVYLFDYLLFNLVIIAMTKIQKDTDAKFIKSVSHII